MAAGPRTALLTGATGFIGHHLLRTLAEQGWDVHLLVRPSSDLSALGADRARCCVHRYDGSGDSIAAAVQAARPTAVFHLASCFLAEHRSDQVEDLIASNVLLGTQIAEALAPGCTFVNTGTAWQHFQDHSYRPVNLYAATKQAFEAVLEYYVEVRRLRAVTLKLFDTYGPDDPRPKLFSLLRRAETAHDPIAMSAGEQLLDLVYIDDVIRAFTAAADLATNSEPGHQQFAVSAGQRIALRELAALYEKIGGVRLNIAWGSRPYRLREVMDPWRGGVPVPGWSPSVTLADGISRTRRWYAPAA